MLYSPVQFERATEAVQRVLAQGQRRRTRNYGLARRAAKAALVSAYFTANPPDDRRWCRDCGGYVPTIYVSISKDPVGSGHRCQRCRSNTTAHRK